MYQIIFDTANKDAIYIEIWSQQALLLYIIGQEMAYFVKVRASDSCQHINVTKSND